MTAKGHARFLFAVEVLAGTTLGHVLYAAVVIYG